MFESLGCSFHHLGIACRHIDAEARHWFDLDYRAEGDLFEDPVQQIRGLFVIGPGPRLELLSALTSTSPIVGLVHRGTKIYHQAFETSRFDNALAAMREKGSKTMMGRSPAVAFNMRRIAFLLMPNMNMIELIEGEAHR